MIDVINNRLNYVDISILDSQISLTIGIVVQVLVHMDRKLLKKILLYIFSLFFII